MFYTIIRVCVYYYVSLMSRGHRILTIGEFFLIKKKYTYTKLVLNASRVSARQPNIGFNFLQHQTIVELRTPGN